MTRRRNERKRRGERHFRTKVSYFILGVHALSLHPSINSSVARSEKINSKKKKKKKLLQAKNSRRSMLKEEVKEKKKRNDRNFRMKVSYFIHGIHASLSHSSINLSTARFRQKKKKNSTKRIRSKDSYKDYYNSIMIETMIVQY